MIIFIKYSIFYCQMQDFTNQFCLLSRNRAQMLSHKKRLRASPAATYHVRRGAPRSKGGDLLRASQPGAAASVRPSRPENDTPYRFLLRTGLDPSSAKNAPRLAGSRPGKRSIRLQKKENTTWCSLSFGIRQLPIFPGRRQPSIVGV